MAKRKPRYKMVAVTKVHGQVLTTHSKEFSAFPAAAKFAARSARLYGEASVIDKNAPTARGYLMVCTETRRARKGGRSGSASVAKCTLSSDAKRLLKSKGARSLAGFLDPKGRGV